MVQFTAYRGTAFNTLRPCFVTVFGCKSCKFLASYPDLNDGDVVGVEERLEARLTVGGQVVFHADLMLSSVSKQK